MYGSMMNAGGARPTRKLVILGVSGSVGSTAFEYLDLRDEMELAAFSVHSSVERVRDILSRYSVPLVAVSSPEVFRTHRDSLERDFPGTRFFGGEEGVVELVRESRSAGADTVLTAVVGACGIQATLAALESGMKVALANKETLVTAGPAIEHTLENMRKGGGELPSIIPVDSEHNAIFQLVESLKPGHLRRVILTASGGPFYDWPGEKIRSVTRDQVLNHPTWNMGPKITVDSAGLINKGLEIIEAHHLFSMPYDSLDVLVHRKSLVHGMVGTADGGYLLCASWPNMVFPVAHALHYPEPVPSPHSVATPPQNWPGLEFETVDPGQFPGFDLCMKAGRTGGTAPALMNAANEVAVELFLEGGIGFTRIPELIGMVLSEISPEYGGDLELYLEADRRARESARRNAKRLMDS